MEYKTVKSVMASQMLWEDYPGVDDSHIHRLLAVANGRMTADEAVAEVISEKGLRDED